MKFFGLDSDLDSGLDSGSTRISVRIFVLVFAQKLRKLRPNSGFWFSFGPFRVRVSIPDFP